MRDVLDERIFTEDAQGELIQDTPHNRLLVRGWSAMTEELVIPWRTDPGDITREHLLATIAGALPVLVEGLPSPHPSPGV